MNKRLFLTLFILLAQSLNAWKASAQATIAVKTDAQQISVGDAMHYFVTAIVDSTISQLRWACYPDTFNTLEITEKGKIDTTRSGSILTFKQRLLITGFDSGSFIIPRFAFFAQQKNGVVDTLFTDSLRLLVNTVPVDTTKPFKGIKGVAEVTTSWMDNLPMIIAIIIALIVGALLVFYFMKNKKTKQPIVAANEETYHQRTLRLLQELDNKELWQQDRIKEYYTELSEIIRQYIETRFQTNAMELTTDELLRKAKKHREMASFSKSLRPLLEAADLAKFAKANPLPEEHIEALALAIGFVKISKPKEQIITPTIHHTQARKK